MSDQDRIYPCVDCGVLRSKDEGGTTFTVCDECWDKKYPQGDTPITDKTREEIAKQLMAEYGDAFDYPVVDRILAIQEIKEGQELRRRELAKSRGKCPCLCHTGEPVFHAPACCNQVNKPLASGESR